jgi:hypothetical protein
VPNRQPPPLKTRPTFRSHTEEQYREAIRAAMPEGSILFDYFCQIKYDDIDGQNEWQRGLAEGMRRLAGNLLETVMEKPHEVEAEDDESAA